VSAGVLEPMLIKLKSISFATEAAISILRIDDMIKITPCAPPYPSAPALLRRPSAALAAPAPSALTVRHSRHVRAQAGPAAGRRGWDAAGHGWRYAARHGDVSEMDSFAPCAAQPVQTHC